MTKLRKVDEAEEMEIGESKGEVKEGRSSRGREGRGYGREKRVEERK